MMHLPGRSDLADEVPRGIRWRREQDHEDRERPADPPGAVWFVIVVIYEAMESRSRMRRLNTRMYHGR
jgi:hypothetical protein